MFGCGRAMRGGLEPTLKSSLPYMERKEKQRKFKLGTQQTILNRDNWTSLRYSKVKIIVFMLEKTYSLIQSFADMFEVISKDHVNFIPIFLNCVLSG